MDHLPEAVGTLVHSAVFALAVLSQALEFVLLALGGGGGSILVGEDWRKIVVVVVVVVDVVVVVAVLVRGSGDAGAVDAVRIGIVAHLNVVPVKVNALEDAVSEDVAGGTGNGAVVDFRAVWKDGSRDGGAEGSGDEAQEDDDGSDELHG